MYKFTHTPLHTIALSVTHLFHRNARYSEKAGSSGQTKVLVIRNPLGIGTPDVSLSFPDDVLARFDALAAPERQQVEAHIIAAVRNFLPDYQSQVKSGLLSGNAHYPFRFDDRIFDSH
jgi:hypothetical protein